MKISFCFLAAVMLLSCASAKNQKPASKPNVIVIMADDMGYSDLGCYGGEVMTPNLDKLAAGGMRMTNFYNNARCCPTRASLLTGQYAHKVGLAINGNALTRNGATIAELLKENGYATAMSGKWHLSDDIQQPTKEAQLKWLNHQDYLDQPFASLESYPINRGFQKHYGLVWGVFDYFDPFSLVDGEKNVPSVPKDFYITDAITDHAVQYIDDAAAESKPLFMYVAYSAPHWPLHARPEDMAKYKGKFDKGWDQMRKDRYQRMVQMGLIDPSITTLTDVQGNLGEWDKLSASEKVRQARKMETHAAMIDRLDQGVGEIVEELKRKKMLDNTMIIFLADNGASPELPTIPGYDRPSETRAGVKMVYSPTVTTDIIGAESSYTGIGPNWANSANTPYKFWKLESFEGGIHTPLIVHWPAGLGVMPGTLHSELGHVTDIAPTILDAAGISYPSSYNGHQLTALDGKSFLPLLKGQNYAGREKIFFEHETGKAYMNGRWKIVQHTKSDKWELYNLATDANEQKDLAASEPARLKTMIEEWNSWYASMKPYINLRPGSGPR